MEIRKAGNVTLKKKPQSTHKKYNLTYAKVEKCE